MTVKTDIGYPVSEDMLGNYFTNLVNQVYKILPMRETKQETLPKYIWRLEAELIGCRNLLPPIKEDAYFCSLLNILQYLKDFNSECAIEQVRQLVFEAIHLCEKLKARYINLDSKG